MRINVELKDCLAWLEKQGEQKLAWSEEDEEMIDFMIEFIESLWWRKDLTQRKDNVLSWLKSLKPNHWKPSEFQLECLRRVIPHHDTEIDNELEYVLTELYEQLKNL